jgi:uncharacterized protein YjbJ (UPF0337 family)
MQQQEHHMNEDRMKGAATNVKGRIKEGAGKMAGDEKMKNEGMMDQAKGKIQNAIGGMKDALKGK